MTPLYGLSGSLYDQSVTNWLVLMPAAVAWW